MLIIADKKIPEDAKRNLQNYGELILLETNGITEESISGHPDIFFFNSPDKLIITPNLPESYKILLRKKNISFKAGKQRVEESYPIAACYNAVVTENFLIHRIDISDMEILDSARHLNHIQVRQGFTRCSLLPLRDNNFITSDKGIYDKLVQQRMQVLQVNPHQILLPGHSNGFFGGACGIYNDCVFFLGSLTQFSDGKIVKMFLEKLGYNIIELCDGPLFDGGSVLFIAN